MSDSNRRHRGKAKDPGVAMPVPAPLADLPDGYEETLEYVKSLVRQERLQVVHGANRQMILLYWQIGRHILQQQQALGWGAKVIDRLAYDLKQVFPEMKGVSPPQPQIYA